MFQLCLDYSLHPNDIFHQTRMIIIRFAHTGWRFFVTVIFPDFSLLFPNFQVANFFLYTGKRKGKSFMCYIPLIRIIEFPDYSKNLKDSLTFPGFSRSFQDSLTFPGFPDFPENGYNPAQRIHVVRQISFDSDGKKTYLTCGST